MKRHATHRDLQATSSTTPWARRTAAQADVRHPNTGTPVIDSAANNQDKIQRLRDEATYVRNAATQCEEKARAADPAGDWAEYQKWTAMKNNRLVTSRELEAQSRNLRS
jgi:hypothetical protein